MNKTTGVGMWFVWFNVESGWGVDIKNRQDKENAKRENNSSGH